MVGAGLWMINVLGSTMLVQYVCLKIAGPPEAISEWSGPA